MLTWSSTPPVPSLSSVRSFLTARHPEASELGREVLCLPCVLRPARDPATVDDKYKVILFPDSESIGIGWIATEDTFSDLLIGHMDPLTVSEAEEIAERYRKTNPQLGTKKLRGGQLVLIPVRQPLSIMVADGYAAIGDSAFMTVPIIGSGIGNAIKNSKILAETIIGDKTETYSAETRGPTSMSTSRRWARTSPRSHWSNSC